MREREGLWEPVWSALVYQVLDQRNQAIKSSNMILKEQVLQQIVNGYNEGNGFPSWVNVMGGTSAINRRSCVHRREWDLRRHSIGVLRKWALCGYVHAAAQCHGRHRDHLLSNPHQPLDADKLGNKCGKYL